MRLNKMSVGIKIEHILYNNIMSELINYSGYTTYTKSRNMLVEQLILRHVADNEDGHDIIAHVHEIMQFSPDVSMYKSSRFNEIMRYNLKSSGIKEQEETKVSPTYGYCAYNKSRNVKVEELICSRVKDRERVQVIIGGIHDIMRFCPTTSMYNQYRIEFF